MLKRINTGNIRIVLFWIISSDYDVLAFTASTKSM
jgi:hypothetical protein